MKLLYTLLLITVTSIISHAQTEDVITGINDPTTIFKLNDLMFYGEFFNNLRVFDITSPELGTEAISNTSGIYRSTRFGDELYYTELNRARISKINLTGQQFTPIAAARELIRPFGITSDEEYIYVADRITEDSTALVRFRPADPENRTVIFQTIDYIVSLCKLDNYIYYLDLTTASVYLLDISTEVVKPELVASGFEVPTDIIGRDETLIVSDFESGRIVKIDLSSPSFEQSNILTGLDQPTGMFLEENDLYIGIFEEGKIIKTTIQLVSNKDFTENKISLFPNPTSNYLQVTGQQTDEFYKVINTSGSVVLKGNLEKSGIIEVHNLPIGNYFIRFQTGIKFSFVKN